ncbi:uncharacterized protein DSM5745_04913 [Aspergillus mulundensis]|uniref:Helix-turn-helix domain-containing protein n=1 Tax=Aspergillus mulundensis TaxID=1810919 RepID=A0A3D8S528_9EURO|nr:Uncharacterized protein DSM5745_04913 [Aspergillus mulundensis]RDW81356.1 Uncharacterized protein DSM5745_04913 [Aspergillus mulundensis]
MGGAASKPARSAAQAASRRTYPKQPSAPSPSPASRPPAQRSPPPPSPASRQPKFESQPQSSAQGVGLTYHSKEQASTEKSSAIDLDGRDPHFAASLRSIGPVTPHPTLSHSSTFNQSQNQPAAQASPSVFPSPSTNPALLVVTSRQRIAAEAEGEAEDYGKGAFEGRRYLDAFTIRQALAMRDRQGLPADEIERVLRLKSGVVGRMGGKGVFGVV